MLNMLVKVIIGGLIVVVIFLWMVMLGSGHKIIPENNVPFAVTLSILIILFVLLKKMKKS
jgi:hypothetical protein